MIKHRTLKNTRRKIALHAQLFRAGLTLPPGPERFNYSLLRAIRRECYGLALAAFVLLAPPAPAQIPDIFRTEFIPPPMSAQTLQDVTIFAAALVNLTETADPAARTEQMRHYAGFFQSIGPRHLLDLDRFPELENERRSHILGTLRPPQYLTDAQQTAFAIAINAIVLREQYPRSFRVMDKRARLPTDAKAPKTIGNKVFFY